MNFKHVKDADAIVVGAGSGMSRAKRCIEVTWCIFFWCV